MGSGVFCKHLGFYRLLFSSSCAAPQLVWAPHLGQGGTGVYLLVQCVLWQRRKGGFAALSGQLLGIWQLFLVLYLLLFGVVEAGLRFVPNLGMEMGVFDIMTVCMAFQWFLPVIFPGMPLIITGTCCGRGDCGGWAWGWPSWEEFSPWAGFC